MNWIVCLGGPMQEFSYKGKTYLFEYTAWAGPVPIHKATYKGRDPNNVPAAIADLPEFIAWCDAMKG